MRVYVLLSIREGERAAKTSALVYSGYEADEPELHILLALAKKLSFSLEALRGERYRVVGADTVAYMLGASGSQAVTRGLRNPMVDCSSGERARRARGAD